MDNNEKNKNNNENNTQNSTYEDKEVKVICENFENFTQNLHFKIKFNNLSTYEEIKDSLNNIKALNPKTTYIFIFQGKEENLRFGENEFEFIKKEILSDSFKSDKNNFIIKEDLNIERISDQFEISMKSVNMHQIYNDSIEFPRISEKVNNSNLIHDDHHRSELFGSKSLNGISINFQEDIKLSESVYMNQTSKVEIVDNSKIDKKLPILPSNSMEKSEMSYIEIKVGGKIVEVRPDSKENFLKYKADILCFNCNEILYDAKSCKKKESNICLKCVLENMTDDEKLNCPCCDGEYLEELAPAAARLLKLIYLVCDKNCGKDVTLFDYEKHLTECTGKDSSSILKITSPKQELLINNGSHGLQNQIPFNLDDVKIKDFPEVSKSAFDAKVNEPKNQDNNDTLIETKTILIQNEKQNTAEPKENDANLLIENDIEKLGISQHDEKLRNTENTIVNSLKNNIEIILQTSQNLQTSQCISEDEINQENIGSKQENKGREIENKLGNNLGNQLENLLESEKENLESKYLEQLESQKINEPEQVQQGPQRIQIIEEFQRKSQGNIIQQLNRNNLAFHPFVPINDNYMPEDLMEIDEELKKIFEEEKNAEEEKNEDEEDDQELIDKKIKESKEIYEQAKLLESNGDKVQAIAGYKEAIRLNPNFSQAFYSLGKIYKNDENFPVAISYFKRAAELDPNNSNTLNHLGLIFRKMRKDQNAEYYYKKALEAYPGNTNAANNLGLLYHKHNIFDRAEDIYIAALEYNDTNSDIHNNLAITLKAVERFDEALKHYQLAVKYSPNESEYHNNLGGMLKKIGKIDESINEFQISIAINPNGSDAHNFIGLLLQKQGRYEESEFHHKKAIAIKSEDSEYHNNIGTLYKKQKKFELAEKSYLEALRIDPKNCFVIFNLAILYDTIGNVDKSILTYKQALEIKPNDCDVFYNLGHLFKRQGDPVMANYYFSKAIENCVEGTKLWDKQKKADRLDR